MKKRGKRKIRECAYCGEMKEVSRDHVIPECLFKRPYPANLITVPACDKCNNAKSLNDDFLRDMLICDIFGSQSPVAQDIFHEKVLSSVRQDSSVIARDATLNARVEPFYTKQGVYLGHETSFPIDSERVKVIFTALVRGLYYDARRQRFPDNYVIEVLRYYPWDFEEVWQVFFQLHPNGPRTLGNVFGCAFVSAQEEPFSTYWLFWFYERVLISVSAMHPKFVHP
ncbi:MAG TPA: hypothetical protein VNO50_13360 [Pyrinomonadaceae bacterium]|nr:hypothetical protein [Pyrinomonadaceae bacterium]